jgi:hypothetical protein
MKGVVLAIWGILIIPLLSFGGTADFEIGTADSFRRNPAATLTVPVTQRRSVGQWIADAQSERRGSRPIVAYTLFQFDSKYAEVAVQPVFGRINGAQLHLSF